MNSFKNAPLVLVLAAMSASATPAAASAQDVTLASLDVPEIENLARAEDLEARARDLTEGPRWATAVGLYRGAAELRGVGDPIRGDDLRMVGYIEFYQGRATPALAALTEAADAFLALGDVQAAASVLIDGSWMAAHSGEAAEAHALGTRAFFLTRSPLLAADSRTALLRRLGVAGL